MFFSTNIQTDFFDMKYLYIYPYVKIIHGSRSSLLLNFINGDIFKLDSQFIKFIKLYSKTSIKQLYEKYAYEETNKFVEFITENNLGKILSYKNLPGIIQPSTKLKNWQIEIVELELSDSTIKNFKYIYEKLNSYNCHTYFFIINEGNNKLNLIFSFLEKLSFSFNLVFNFDFIDKYYLEKLSSIKNLFFAYFRTWNDNSISISEYAPFFKLINEYQKIQVTKGIYEISQEVHPYFYSRIYINGEGKYSNSYNDQSFIGNFLHDSSKKIIRQLIKSKYWEIKRDDIIDCKECEFRYCCIDNKIPKKYGINTYRLTTNCKFSPYEA